MNNLSLRCKGGEGSRDISGEKKILKLIKSMQYIYLVRPNRKILTE